MAVRTETTTPTWHDGRVTSWLTTLDHKRIGILYIGTAGVFFAISGFLALLIRTQLARPDSGVITGNSYNEVVTMHGTGMVFFVMVPVLAGLANFVAAIVFLFIADVAWLPAALIAIGSTAGGLLGAGVGRRLSDPWLRAIIVVVGLAAIAQLVL